MGDFSTIANVAPAYVHRDKRITPAAPLPLKGGQLKWYDVAYPETLLPTGLTSYEPLVPYLHSTSLRWSGPEV